MALIEDVLFHEIKASEDVFGGGGVGGGGGGTGGGGVGVGDGVGGVVAVLCCRGCFGVSPCGAHVERYNKLYTHSYHGARACITRQ